MGCAEVWLGLIDGRRNHGMLALLEVHEAHRWSANSAISLWCLRIGVWRSERYTLVQHSVRTVLLKYQST